MQHSSNFKLKFEVSIFFKLIFVNHLPVPLMSIFELALVNLLTFLIILSPSLILLEPPVKITILEFKVLECFCKDNIFSLNSNNPAKK